jgi:hypothetical protein
VAKERRAAVHAVEVFDFHRVEQDRGMHAHVSKRVCVTGVKNRFAVTRAHVPRQVPREEIVEALMGMGPPRHPRPWILVQGLDRPTYYCGISL